MSIREQIELQDIKRVNLAEKMYALHEYLKKQIDAVNEYTKLDTAALMHFTQLSALAASLKEIWDDFLYLDNMRLQSIEDLQSIVEDSEKDSYEENN